MIAAEPFETLRPRLVEILGEQHVTLLDAAGANRYGLLRSAALAGVRQPVAVLEPASVEALQAVAKLAGTAGFALWSTANDCGNGARLGNTAQPALLLDLSRMNRILEIDAQSACVLLEPGVSFERLRAHIDEHALPFWIDSDANGAHSVCGSICERGLGATPYGDHLLMQCGFEVMLADGRLVRTGMGALPGNNTWQLFKYNFGPYLDGLFSRSDFGIVTKVGLWLMPAPPAWRPFMVTLPDEDTLGAAVDLLRPFKIDLSLPGPVTISHIDADRALAGTPAGASPGEPERGRAGAWTLYGALHGLPDNVDFLWAHLRPALAALAGVRVYAVDDAPDDAPWRLRSGLTRGIPAHSRHGEALESRLWFKVAAPLEGEAARAMLQLTRSLLTAHATDARLEFALGWRVLFLHVDMPCTPADYAIRRTAALELIGALGGAGYAVSHESADLSPALDALAAGSGLAHLLAGLGRALDPGGLLGDRSS